MTGIMQMLTGGTYTPPGLTIGQAYGGGFYAGKINVSGTIYNLVVAPKSSGEASNKTWGTAGIFTFINSVIDGPTNSAALAALGSDYQAAIFCEGLTIGGYSDWYLPAKNELEVLYYNLKPTTTANDTGSGSNANAVSPEPVSTNYTGGTPATGPAQTASGISFRTGESEALVSDYYWTSTEYNQTYSWIQDFNTGGQYAPFGYGYKNVGFYVRAVRRVLA